MNKDTYKLTRQRILDISLKLFLEKGYDNTSIQDIIDELGMTKGALYYNFESKEDILYEIIVSKSKKEKTLESDMKRIKNIDCSGLDKLKEALKQLLTYYSKEPILETATIVYKSPRMIGERYIESIRASEYIKEFIDEGIEDGTLETEYSEEIANMILLYSNMNIGLHLDTMDREEFLKKIKFFGDFLIFTGIDIDIKEFKEEIIRVYDEAFSKKSSDI